MIPPNVGAPKSLAITYPGAEEMVRKQLVYLVHVPASEQAEKRIVPGNRLMVTFRGEVVGEGQAILVEPTTLEKLSPYDAMQGGYESVETPFFLSNEVQPQVVGPAIEIEKSVEPETVRDVTSLARSGDTATVTTSVAHGWTNGARITIAGASPSAYNGTHTITVASPTSFTFPVAGTPATPATGTITATGPTVVAFPNQLLTFHVRVRNTGTGTASSVRIDDTIPPNTTYVAGSMAFSLNSGGYTALTDASDLDQAQEPPALLNVTLPTLSLLVRPALVNSPPPKTMVLP